MNAALSIHDPRNIAVPVFLKFTSGVTARSHWVIALENDKLWLSPDTFRLHGLPIHRFGHLQKWEILFKGTDNSIGFHGLAVIDRAPLHRAVRALLGIL